ncbi:hypothetical protein CROQUDRAFT_108127 [Cronartium quercuum f. sp. fusiforme G11]|uniref:Uncharacterized protein n=1 Tax=Cronartium quercuum f. sp. fusiforme G11 TaxID=708437 RepID=A0A9P6TBT4_9BASI|nr:hypothetical protein CROQUDRAFT_108127 [Cronartium quercuum f. sp. fusiforme G11]
MIACPFPILFPRRTNIFPLAILFIALVTLVLVFKNTLRWNKASAAPKPFLDYKVPQLPLPSNVSTEDDQILESVRAVFNRIQPYLQAWKDRPVSSYPEAILANQISCGPERDQQSNPDQLRNSAKAWTEIDSKTIVSIRSEAVTGVERFFQSLLYPKTNSIYHSTLTLQGIRKRPLLGNGTEGIVITGGNKDTMRRLMVMLRFLRRKHQCRLPVEIFMFPDEIPQVSQFQAELQALGYIEIKRLPYEKDPKAWKNFHIKGASIVHSSFTKLLYLDSDNIPLADPSFLFKSRAFKEWGIVLWPDITKDGAKNPIWRIAGQTCIPQDWQIDSGQILVDKSAQRGLVFGALLLAAQMQLNHDFWFQISEGDKDTFRYALYALQLPWTRAPHWLSSAGAYNMGSYCDHTMFQYSLSPSDWADAYPSFSISALSDSQKQHAPPLFAHINLLKHNVRFGRGETFKVLHRLAPSDLVSRSNLNVSDRVRTKVSSGKGMCIHYSIQDKSITQSVRPVNQPGDPSEAWVLEETWKEAWGGLLKDFESTYWANGGL